MSFLHLITGRAPYEELMEEVKCPVFLQNSLRAIWNTTDVNSPYSVIKDVLVSLDISVDNAIESPIDESVLSILYDTLYRYVVLLGLPARDLFSSIDQDTGRINNNPVVDALFCALTEDTSCMRCESVADARDQYKIDSKRWNIFCGYDETMDR